MAETGVAAGRRDVGPHLLRRQMVRLRRRALCRRAPARHRRAHGRHSSRAVREALPQVVNTPELRFDCDDARKFAVIEEVAARLTAEGATVSRHRRRAGADARMAGGCCARPTPRRCWWPAPRRKDEAGLERLKAASGGAARGFGYCGAGFRGGVLRALGRDVSGLNPAHSTTSSSAKARDPPSLA